MTDPQGEPALYSAAEARKRTNSLNTSQARLQLAELARVITEACDQGREAVTVTTALSTTVVRALTDLGYRVARSQDFRGDDYGYRISW